MKRIGYSILPALAFAVLAATTASATPVPNSAVLHLRVFNDCPISVLNTTNAFPALIQIDDQNQIPPFCAGFANLHTWRFSTDGVNAIQFLNGDAFQYSANFTINGAGEGGLSMSPWFSPDADGQFNVRSTDGEIACFGGRMPFYSFTGSQGLVYVNNTPIFLEILYNPRSLSSVAPAQITYNIRYNSINYTSGPLNFDEGNTSRPAARSLARSTRGTRAAHEDVRPDDRAAARCRQDVGGSRQFRATPATEELGRDQDGLPLVVERKAARRPPGGRHHGERHGQHQGRRVGRCLG
jgi:hypothetical protein